MAPLRIAEATKVVRQKCLVRRTTRRLSSRHGTTRARAAHALPASKDEQVPTAVEDPPQRVELAEFTELAEPPPRLGAPSAGTVPAEDSVARGTGVDARDPSKTVPAEDVPCAETESSVEESGVHAGDEDDCLRGVHKVSSDVSDEDRSTVAPSETDVSSDEDQSTVDADGPSAYLDCEFRSAALCGVRTDLDVGNKNHTTVVCRVADVCCENRGNTVSHEVSRETEKVHDIVGSDRQHAGGCEASADADVGTVVHEESRETEKVHDIVGSDRQHAGGREASADADVGTVAHEESRETEKVHDIVGSDRQHAGGHDVDVDWEDRGAVAAATVLRRILSRTLPVAEVLPLPVFPGSRSRRVRFDMGAIVLHEIPPYGEIYGAHPRTFVFDRHSRRVPAAPNGYVSLHAVTRGDEDEEDSSDASSSDEEEITIFGKGARTDLQDSEAEVGAEEDSWESYLEETSDEYSRSSPAEHVCIPSCGLRRFLGA